MLLLASLQWTLLEKKQKQIKNWTWTKSPERTAFIIPHRHIAASCQPLKLLNYFCNVFFLTPPLSLHSAPPSHLRSAVLLRWLVSSVLQPVSNSPPVVHVAFDCLHVTVSFLTAQRVVFFWLSALFVLFLLFSIIFSHRLHPFLNADMQISMQ